MRKYDSSAHAGAQKGSAFGWDWGCHGGVLRGTSAASADSLASAAPDLNMSDNPQLRWPPACADGGEDNEQRLLSRRLRAAVDNYGELLLASRNLNFFTSFYR